LAGVIRGMGFIPNKPTTAKGFSKEYLLLLCGINAVFIGFFDYFLLLHI
jgi:uncharacterized membrane protein YuzA (DUF378 family)